MSRGPCSLCCLRWRGSHCPRRFWPWRCCPTRPPRWPVGYYRLVATETRASDNLVVLHFEYRTYPFITASSAYLASRCSPLSQIDPKQMSGGRGPDTESELKYLRSATQPPC